MALTAVGTTSVAEADSWGGDVTTKGVMSIGGTEANGLEGSDGSDGVAEDVVVREMESESGLASRIEGSFSSCP